MGKPDEWDDIIPRSPWKRRTRIPPWPVDDREEILDSLRKMKRTCSSCGDKFPVNDRDIGKIYKFCPWCGALVTGAATLEEIKFLLEQVNSKLGRYLERLRRRRSKAKGG